ncbi:Leucine zipper domain-containing protein [Dioscorea alata]|uniref:Leucine zipper domain-containing protein n=1 Tax=Dioscorea alata TaxID=55571 RepID=A0ACB7WVH8_DIOAL|nr:Leucine zipper domain-containing protein [Dioscorea alata]
MTSLITNIKTNHQGPLLQDFLPGGVFYKGSPLPDIINCDSSQTSSGDVNCNNGNLEVMCSLSGSKVCCDKVGVVDERKKMDHDQDLSNIGSRAARRRRRLIKNRESAARSRARKQLLGLLVPGFLHKILVSGDPELKSTQCKSIMLSLRMRSTSMLTLKSWRRQLPNC